MKTIVLGPRRDATKRHEEGKGGGLKLMGNIKELKVLVYLFSDMHQADCFVKPTRKYLISMVELAHKRKMPGWLGKTPQFRAFLLALTLKLANGSRRIDALVSGRI